MKLNKKKSEQLKQLELLLRSAVHHPGCDRLTVCPKQCRCRERRTFKLNTETSICWEMAEVFKYCRGCGCTGSYVNKNTSAIALAYHDLARYHMSDGWGTLFNNIYYILNMMRDSDRYVSSEAMTDKYLEKIKKSIPRLKRYPR